MIDVVVVSIQDETQAIRRFELARPDGAPLPPFDAGAHIDVHLPEGLVRQYSLCNDPQETHRYVIGVLRDPASRGGSAALHERVKRGDRLRIGAPRNLFALTPGARHNLLVAGGIGITPLLCMAERLVHTEASFALHYCARSRDSAAFVPRLQASAFADRVALHFDDQPTTRLDAARLLAAPQAEVHLYVCGPTGFMEHVLATARDQGWPEARLHREYFAAAPPDTDADASFSVQIASTGQILAVPADRSVAQVLEAHGLVIPLSCEQGVCGTCLTRVLQGVPEHRDLFMTEEEQALNDQFTPCCSRAKSPLLVLDL